VKTVTNKQLLISESRGDLNRCTPCRRKSDQYDTYASHISPRTPDVHFLWIVPACDRPPWKSRGLSPKILTEDSRMHKYTHKHTIPWYSSYKVVIGLYLSLTALVSVAGRKRKILTCTQTKQNHKKQKLERLRSIRLIRRDPKATNSKHAKDLSEVTDSNLLAPTTNHF
jgi:hypothetical protein